MPLDKTMQIDMHGEQAQRSILNKSNFTKRSCIYCSFQGKRLRYRVAGSWKKSEELRGCRQQHLYSCIDSSECAGKLSHSNAWRGTAVK